MSHEIYAIRHVSSSIEYLMSRCLVFWVSNSRTFIQGYTPPTSHPARSRPGGDGGHRAVRASRRLGSSAIGIRLSNGVNTRAPVQVSAAHVPAFARMTRCNHGFCCMLHRVLNACSAIDPCAHSCPRTPSPGAHACFILFPRRFAAQRVAGGAAGERDDRDCRAVAAVAKGASIPVLR